MKLREESKNERTGCCWFELFQHQDTCAVSLLWATAAGFLTSVCDGQKFHKIDSMHVVSLALGRALSSFWASHKVCRLLS